MYMSGDIDEKALKVSNGVVPIIEQLRSNHEEQPHTCCLPGQTRPQRGIVASPDTDMFFYMHIILVARAYVKYSLIQEGNNIHVLRSGVELPSPTDYGYENNTDTGHNLLKIVSQPLAPPDLVRSVKTFVAIIVCVRQMNKPVLKLAIVQELLEFLRILSLSHLHSSLNYYKRRYY